VLLVEWMVKMVEVAVVAAAVVVVAVVGAHSG